MCSAAVTCSGVPPPVWETAWSSELSCYCWGEIALTPSARFVCLNPTGAPAPAKTCLFVDEEVN